ncbi:MULTISPECIES: PD-(D/E)XK nuclease family protein [Flavobacterium]|uniref:PD-(D/E)XK nuclease superfamily protein n=1 Tax=Flavobacterium hankyongi TaxID=1176532 RepID=A0ABP8ZU59_9FLAO|nr:PD-(D/E)XK nuclease family protein [Flavobacterium sp. N1846]
MDIKVLEHFLNQNEIPIIKGKPKTFLGIAKQPHYENVLSNIYAFFFNVNEVHKLKDLFIKSLVELINTSKLGKENKVFESFLNFEVLTEYGTINQKRIDILLQNNEQAIIIENKVYHELNNDLEEYYNEIKVTTKMGIVLSLHPISDISHDRYINITHQQYMAKVMHNLGNYVLHANDKYLVFLKDFYQNIINLSHPVMEKEAIQFYYKNQQEINELVRFKFKLREHIVNQIVTAGNRLDGVSKYEPRANTFNDKRLVYYVSNKHKELMFTVVYENLLTDEKVMYIAVEMEGSLLKDRTIYNQIDFTEEEKKYAFAEHFKTTTEYWSHFAVVHYHPTEDEISNLSQFIIDKLKNDCLLSIFNKLEMFIDTNLKS